MRRHLPELFCRPELLCLPETGHPPDARRVPGLPWLARRLLAGLAVPGLAGPVLAGCDDARTPAPPDSGPTATDAAFDGSPEAPDDGAGADAFYDPVPRTFIEDAPPGHTNLRNVALHFTSSVAFSHYECALDDAPLAYCRLRIVFEDLAEGPHRVRAVAISPTGLRDPTGAEIAFVVDRTAPRTRIYTAPAPQTGEDTLTLEFGAEEAADFACKIDGGGARRCTSPLTVGPLGEGVHGVTVTATDLAGNVDPTPAAVQWRIDRSAPDTRITSGPDALWRAPRATFDFESPDGDATGFECALDAAAFAPCGAPTTVDGLGEGLHRFAVRALDALQQADPSPATLDFEVHLAPPETEIRTAPPARTADREARFEFGPEGARFQCALDGEPPAPCDAAFELHGLSEGSHRLQVVADDGAGHADPTPAHAEWTVDLSPPAVQISGGPPALSNQDSVEFHFEGVDAPADGGGPITFSCALDEAPPAPCLSPLTIDDADALTEGLHVFRVEAVDDVGHHTPVPAALEFALDRTPPRTADAEGPGGATTSTAAFVQFVPEPGAEAECSLDDAPFVPCAPGRVASGLADGPHHLALRQRDAAGNVEAPPVAFDWVVDTTPPALVFTATPPVESLEAVVVFDFATRPEEAATFTCRTDDAPDETPCAPPVTVADLAEGPHRFEVSAADALGNATPAALVFEFTVDARPPAAPAAPTVFPGDGTLLITWEIPAPPADTVAWRVRRTRLEGEVPFPLADVPAEPTPDGFHAFLDTARPEGVPFTYALQALDRHGRASESGPGATMAATASGTSAVLDDLPGGTIGGAALRDGRVLLIGGRDAPGATLFTPAGGGIDARDPVAPLDGSGLAHLPDGRLIAVCGTGTPVPDEEGGLDWPGQENVQAFDPDQDAWVPLAPLTGGPRIGPTAVVLPRGQVAVVGGTTELPPDAAFWRADLYDADFDAWSLPFPAPRESLTPGLWVTVLTTGDLLLLGDAGGLVGNPVTGQFEFLAAGLPARAGRALLESGEVLMVGGLPPASVQGTLLDPLSGLATATEPLATPRTGAQLVLLPGGDALVVGGATLGEHAVERFETERARFVPAGSLNRAQDAATWAVLLPDAAVLVAGAEGVERYAPWYLNAGPRPAITDAPVFVNRGQAFVATASGRLPVVQWVMIRLGAVSQGQNTDQRHLTLPFVDEGGGRHRITPPADRTAAVPGPYLLFALDARGVPGEARVILVQ